MTSTFWGKKRETKEKLCIAYQSKFDGVLGVWQALREVS